MCRLVLDENLYNTSLEYWQAVIINMPDGFTLHDILSQKNDITNDDLKQIYKIIRELGEINLIKRIEDKFYIQSNPIIA